MYGINNNGELIVTDPWTEENNPLRVSMPESFDNVTLDSNRITINGSKKSDVRRIVAIQNYASEEYPGSEIDLFLSQLVFMRSWDTLTFLNRTSTETFEMSPDVIHMDARKLSDATILVPDELARLINEIQSRRDWDVRIEELDAYLNNMVDHFFTYQDNMNEWVVVKSYLFNVLNNKSKWKIISLL